MVAIMRVAIACKRRVIGAAGGDDREFVAAEPGDQVVAAQGAGEPLGDAADQLVADRMAERIVDVLEMVEIDVEHGRGRTALAHLLDHRLEPLAEKDAVGQPAERIVQGEMPQPRFAGRDGRGRAPHVAEDQRGQQREAGERDGDEGNDAVNDLGAGLLRRPGELRDRRARADRSDRRRSRRRRRTAFSSLCRLRSWRRDAMSASTSSSMNLTLRTTGAPSVGLADVSSGAVDRHAGDDGGAAEKCLQAHGAVAAGIFGTVHRRCDAAGVRLSRPAHEIEHGVRSGWIELNQFGSTLRWPSEA